MRKKVLFGAVWGVLGGLALLFISGCIWFIFDFKDWQRTSPLEVLKLMSFSGTMAIIFYCIVVIPVAGIIGAVIASKGCGGPG